MQPYVVVVRIEFTNLDIKYLEPFPTLSKYSLLWLLALFVITMHMKWNV